jgi:C4-dicarboxylate transporter DctM subunit
VICGACAMGILVPPSIGMVVFGGLANVSIGALFLAGFIPAAICAAAMMFHLYLEARRLDLQVRPKASFGEVLRAFGSSLWALMVPVIIFVGIIGGIVTPTEAAVLAVVYALVVDVLVFRELTLQSLVKAFQDTVIMTGTVGLLIALSALLAYVLTLEQVPQRLAQFAVDMDLGATGLIIAIFVLFLLLGMVMDGLAAMIMIVPLLIPFFGPFGLDPIHVGIVILASIGIGLFTPPVGAGLVVACSVGRVSAESATREMLPYLGTVLLALLLIILFPKLVTFLPDLAGM